MIRFTIMSWSVTNNAVETSNIPFDCINLLVLTNKYRPASHGYINLMEPDQK